MEFQHGKQQKITLEEIDRYKRLMKFKIDFDFIRGIQGASGTSLTSARMVLNSLVSPCQICCSLLCPLYILKIVLYAQRTVCIDVEKLFL
jgi:hypothetical protein